MSNSDQSSLGTVIPVYIKNPSDWIQLRRALDSIRRQTLLPAEIVLTDDSDEEYHSDVIKVIDEYPELSVTIARNTDKRGISTNSNNGLTLIHSDYVHVLHQDDWLESPTAYKRAMDFFHKNSETFLFLGSARDGRIFTPKFELTALLGNNQFGGPSGVIFPSNSKILFDSDFEMLCDIDFVYRLILKLGLPKVLEGNIVQYGYSEDQAQRRISRDSISSELKLIQLKHGLKRYKMFMASFQGKKIQETYSLLDSLINSSTKVYEKIMLQIIMKLISLQSKFKR